MMIYQLEEMKDVKKDVSMLKDTMRISGQQEFENMYFKGKIFQHHLESIQRN